MGEVISYQPALSCEFLTKEAIASDWSKTESDEDAEVMLIGSRFESWVSTGITAKSWAVFAFKSSSCLSLLRRKSEKKFLKIKKKFEDGSSWAVDWLSLISSWRRASPKAENRSSFTRVSADRFFSNVEFFSCITAIADRSMSAFWLWSRLRSSFSYLRSWNNFF